MFSFFSQIKVKRFLFTGLVLVLLAGFMGGCKNEVDDDSTKGLPNALVGKWVAAYGDFYQINTGTLKYDGGGGYVKEGNIRDVTNFNDESGVIIVEYSSGHTNPAKPFGAVYYLNRTSSAVSFNDAWDATAADYDANTATLETAKAKFTQASMGNYVDAGMATTYTKQN